MIRTDQGLYFGNSRLTVFRDLRTKQVKVTIDDGQLVEPGDPWQSRTPKIIARGHGDSLIEALQSIRAINAEFEGGDNS